jgi:hypothetical protein
MLDDLISPDAVVVEGIVIWSGGDFVPSLQRPGESFPAWLFTGELPARVFKVLHAGTRAALTILRPVTRARPRERRPRRVARTCGSRGDPPPEPDLDPLGLDDAFADELERLAELAPEPWAAELREIAEEAA